MTRACPKCGSQFPNEAFFCGFDGEITVEEQRPDDPDPRLGTRLGDYVLVARVADGAMGRVYEGRHFETKARVAIKVLHQSVLADPVAVERFRREYETADEFEHPYIVDVLEHGDTPDGSHFMTMEYLEGEELSQAIHREGSIEPPRALRLLSQLALGLQHAHSFGVVHRDLKPDNIFVCETEDGEVVRLLDFGSVKLQMAVGPKLTALGTTLGSPYYMSPEQAMGRLDVDQRTDVFALAAIFFEMATGKVAFEGGNVAEILMRIVQHDPPPISESNPAYPPALNAVMTKALAKEKEQRFGSCVEFVSALLRGFGLDGDVSKWAETGADEIAQAIERAPAPSVTEVATPSVPVIPPRSSQQMAPERDSILSTPPTRPRSKAWLAGVLAVGIAVVAGAYLLLS